MCTYGPKGGSKGLDVYPRPQGRIQGPQLPQGLGTASIIILLQVFVSTPSCPRLSSSTSPFLCTLQPLHRYTSLNRWYSPPQRSHVIALVLTQGWQFMVTVVLLFRCASICFLDM